jgi:hypothetical protein
MDIPKDIVGFTEYFLGIKLDDWQKKYLEKAYELYKDGKLNNENAVKITCNKFKAKRDTTHLLQILWYENLKE